MLLLPRQKAKLNQAIKPRHETAPIRLFDTHKQFNSSPIDCMPQRG